MDREGSGTGHTRQRSSSIKFSIVDPKQGAARDSNLAGQIPETGDDDGNMGGGDDRIGSPGASDSDWEMDDIDPHDRLEDDEETGLTGHDRRKRSRRKRRNTQLDERVATEEAAIAKVEEQIATQSFIKAAIINAILIALWYLFSISISVYNKWMFSSDNLDFHFPLFTTSLHMVVQFSLASLVLFCIPSLRPNHNAQNPHSPQYSQVSQTSQEASAAPPKQPVMTKWFYVSRIGPCGAATGLDIGLGNMSLKFISLTFFTMCKSSVLAFVLVFAFLFRLEKPSWNLGGIIVLMTVGVVMMVAGETAFNVLGFVLIMSSAFFSGFRWSLTQILLLRNPATSNPFSSIFFLAPIMFVSLLVIALPVEGPSDLRAGFHTLAEAKGTGLAIVILIFPGILAFLMTASEFALLKRTSVVTLSVCGIFKEVLTISAAGIVFHDKLTPINISGLLVTIASIAAYNFMKMRKMREGARREAHEQVKAEGPLLSTAEGRRSVAGEGGLEGYRISTSSLIRNSLSVSVAGPGDREWPKLAAGDLAVGDRASPVKRPVDLE